MLVLSTLFAALIAMACTTSCAWNRTLRGTSNARPRAFLLQATLAVALASAAFAFARKGSGVVLGVPAGLAIGHLLGLAAVRHLE
jgi:hypothetical protein